MQHLASALVCLTVLLNPAGSAVAARGDAAATGAAAVPAVTGLSPRYGDGGGETITITGAGFTGATAVRFGATAVAFTVNSDTSVTATAPSGSGSTDVTVTTPDGTSATGNDSKFAFDPAKTITFSTSTSTTPRFAFSSAAYAVDEDAGTATITVTAPEVFAGIGAFPPSIAAGPCLVEYATSDGTAEEGVNYTAASGLLDFTSDDTATFSVPVLADGLVTGDLTVNLALSSPTCINTTETTSINTITLGGVVVAVNTNTNTNTDTAALGSPSTAVLTIAGTDAAPVTLTVSPASLPAMTAGTAVSETITASGGTAPYTFAVTGGALPAGLALATSGALTGTPSAAGAYAFTVTATDAIDDTGTRAYDGVIGSAGATIAITPASLDAMTVGVPFTAALIASGGTPPYTFAITDGALPAGLTLDEDGAITGTPSASGDYSVTITVTDSGLVATGHGAKHATTIVGTASMTYSGTVLAPVPSMPWIALGLLGILLFIVARRSVGV